MEMLFYAPFISVLRHNQTPQSLPPLVLGCSDAAAALLYEGRLFITVCVYVRLRCPIHTIYALCLSVFVWGNQ